MISNRVAILSFFLSSSFFRRQNILPTYLTYLSLPTHLPLAFWFLAFFFFVLSAGGMDEILFEKNSIYTPALL